MQEFTEWITTATSGATHRGIATALGTTHPTIRARIDRADPLLALEIAATYGANPIDGLVAAGAITNDQITDYAHAHGIGIDDYTDLELAEKIVERLQRAQERGEESELATVTEFELYAADSSDTEPEPGDPEYHDGP